MALWVLPKQVFTVEPTNQSPNGSALNTTNASPVLREQMDFSPATCQRPTSTGSRTEVAEPARGAASLAHHRTITSVEEVESMSSKQAHGPLRRMSCMDFEGNVNVPARGTVGFEQLELETRADQDAAFNCSNRGDSGRGLP